MKNARLFLFLFSVCLYSCEESINTPLEISTNNELNVFEQESQRRQKQAEAYGYYLQLLDEMQGSTRSTSSSEEYPEFYGGAYINEDGLLVIRMKDKESYTRVRNGLCTRMNQSVIFDPCKFSFNELNTTMQVLLSNITANESMRRNITMLAIDVKHNKVAVCMRDTMCIQAKLLEDFVADSSILTYVKSEDVDSSPIGNELETQSYNASETLMYGGKLAAGYTWGSIKNIGTIGYRAIDRNGKKGFVTAAHVVLDSAGVLLSRIYDAKGSVPTTIGTCYNYAYHNQNMDAAFIQCYDDVTLTNYIPGFTCASSDTLSTELIRPVTGMQLYMIGQVSGIKMGEVIYPSSILVPHNTTDASTGQIVLRDAVVAKFYGTKGDSGALVFGEDAHMRYCAAGIYVGRGILNGETVSTSVIASNVNALLGVTRY